MTRYLGCVLAMVLGVAGLGTAAGLSPLTFQASFEDTVQAQGLQGAIEQASVPVGRHNFRMLVPVGG